MVTTRSFYLLALLLVTRGATALDSGPLSPFRDLFAQEKLIAEPKCWDARPEGKPPQYDRYARLNQEACGALNEIFESNEDWRRESADRRINNGYMNDPMWEDILITDIIQRNLCEVYSREEVVEEHVKCAKFICNGSQEEYQVESVMRKVHQAYQKEAVEKCPKAMEEYKKSAEAGYVATKLRYTGPGDTKPTSETVTIAPVTFRSDAFDFTTRYAALQTANGDTKPTPSGDKAPEKTGAEGDKDGDDTSMAVDNFINSKTVFAAAAFATFFSTFF